MFKCQHILRLSGLYLLCLSASLSAEEPVKPEPDLCPPGHKLQIGGAGKLASDDKRTHIDADSATVDSQEITRFSGDVLIRQTDKELSADQVTYDRRNEVFDAKGNIVFTTGEIRLKGESATLNLQTNQGKIENTQYQAGTVNGRGQANVINIESKHQLSLEGATYTTCPSDDMAWQLKASEINLDTETHQGTASSMVLEVAHIPVFYMPYIRFPFGEDRLSGFLYPAIAKSEKHGTELSIPYYWNIAPNIDATITPHNMSKRGLMLENELRYLTRNNTGNFLLDYLNDDSVYGDNRARFAWTDNGMAHAGWSSNVDYNYVSDVQYLDDFSSTLGDASVTSLNRLASLSYNQSKYIFSAAVQDHQTLSGTDPYKRLPQLILNTRLGNIDNSWNYDINSEFVNFDHRDPSLVIGERLKLSPYLAYPIVKDAGFFKPKLTVNYLQYNLDQLSSSTQADTPDVTVPVFSLDTGIFLERETSFGDTPLLHTLEPRLFYLYAPYKDQNEFPVFDTALTTFSQSTLFAENRFSGNDRIGDANQITAALTTRFYRQDNGAELFNASLGQIFYFRDREVILPGQVVETQSTSSYLAALYFAPHPNWRMLGDMQYDPETNHTEVGNVRLQHRPGPGRVVNLSYRFRRNEIRTEGLSFAWRLNPRWQFLGGSAYDLENDHRLENFLGLHYDDCCWGVRLIVRERFDQLVNNDPNNPRYENAIYLEFELKGLSSLGSGKDIDTLLENGILGYTR